MSSNVEKLMKRNKYLFNCGHSVQDIETHKFYPFYYFASWEVKKSDPVYCDYCGELLEGNGSFSSDYFVFESAEDIRICCNLKCRGGHVWDYHYQKYGEIKPLQLPENSTIAQRMVFNYWFRNSPGYHVMNYSKIDINLFNEIVQPAEVSGGSYTSDGANHIEWKNKRLTIYKEFNDSSVIMSLTIRQVVDVINELLAGMKCFQLELF